MTAQKDKIRLSAVPGYFLQDEEDTKADGFNFINTNFGLIDRAYSDPHADSSSFSPPSSPWARLAAHLAHLNNSAPPRTQYKLVFLARHGEGVHNVAETRYGTPAWDAHWSLLEGDETSSWGDARLTPTGIRQARRACEFWRGIVAEEPAAAPERYFVSPLTRCLQTAATTFEELELPADRPFRPLIVELLRETISRHTCDRRSKRSEIEAMFPGWAFEEGFAEDDPHWSATKDETLDAQLARSKAVLEHMFAEARDATWVSVTSHSGEIRALLAVLGHRPFELGTGQAIPVLIRAEWVSDN